MSQDHETWMDDSASLHCLLCSREFTFTHRRHHCRRCLKLVCGACSNRTADLELDGSVRAHRVCDVCYRALDAAKGVVILDHVIPEAAMVGEAGMKGIGARVLEQVGVVGGKNRQRRRRALVLRATVVAARGLPAAADGALLLSGIGKENTRGRDPYVVLRIGDKEALRTHADSQTLDPVWESTVCVRIDAMTTGTRYLIAEVWDQGQGLGGDQLLGCCRVPLCQLYPGTVSDRWHRLVDPLSVGAAAKGASGAPGGVVAASIVAASGGELRVRCTCVGAPHRHRDVHAWHTTLRSWCIPVADITGSVAEDNAAAAVVSSPRSTARDSAPGEWGTAAAAVGKDSDSDADSSSSSAASSSSSSATSNGNGATDDMATSAQLQLFFPRGSVLFAYLFYRHRASHRGGGVQLSRMPVPDREAVLEVVGGVRHCMASGVQIGATGCLLLTDHRLLFVAQSAPTPASLSATPSPATPSPAQVPAVVANPHALDDLPPLPPPALPAATGAAAEAPVQPNTDEGENRRRRAPSGSQVVSLPLASLFAVKHKGRRDGDSTTASLDVTTKDFRNFRFVFSDDPLGRGGNGSAGGGEMRPAEATSSSSSSLSKGSVVGHSGGGGGGDDSRGGGRASVDGGGHGGIVSTLAWIKQEIAWTNAEDNYSNGPTDRCRRDALRWIDDTEGAPFRHLAVFAQSQRDSCSNDSDGSIDVGDDEGGDKDTGQRVYKGQVGKSREALQNFLKQYEDRRDSDRSGGGLAAEQDTSGTSTPEAASWFDLREEFARQGVFQNDRWRLTSANQLYSLCESYPTTLVVPSSVSDSELRTAASHRSKRRLPVLTWMHPRNGSALCRSSQPMVGITNMACPEDDKLLMAIRQSVVQFGYCRGHMDAVLEKEWTEVDEFEEQEGDAPAVAPHHSEPAAAPRPAAATATKTRTRGRGRSRRVTAWHDEARVLRIIDARPLINAKGNALMGKGHENIARLGGSNCTTLTFQNVANIHVMRDSCSSLVSSCRAVHEEYWAGSIQDSRWLLHLSTLLKGSLTVAKHLEEGDAVLVHCSDGWDRTSQLVSIAQLLLDPHYRTLDGFRDLVEKDWCSFGHQFARRCGKDSEAAPIFLQFLDIAWQLTQQFPRDFEFNERFLLLLLESTYSRWFRNFLGDCDRERRARAAANEHVPSVWDEISCDEANLYRNPIFVPPARNVARPSRRTTAPLYPSCNIRSLQVWRGAFFAGLPRGFQANLREDALEQAVEDARAEAAVAAAAAAAAAAVQQQHWPSSLTTMEVVDQQQKENVRLRYRLDEQRKEIERLQRRLEAGANGGATDRQDDELPHKATTAALNAWRSK